MQTMSDKKAAMLIGAFFILATAMGVSNGIKLGPLIGGSDYLVIMSQNTSAVGLSLLLNLIMAGAVVAIAVMFYPILKRTHETLAVGYLAARLVEGILLAFAGISWLALANLGKEFAAANPSAAGQIQILGDLVKSTGTTTFTLGAEITFGFTALILNYIFMQTRMVPRWISIWGFVGGALLLTLGAMKILGLPVSAIEIAFTVPIALNEMVLAVWLIMKGFAPPIEATG